MSTRLTLDDRFSRIEHALIGLWRFRVRGEKARWCCTYVHDGCYYDIHGKDTVEEALDAVYKNLRSIERRSAKQ